MEQRTKARELRLHATDAERRLWQHISNRQLAGVRFNRQVPIGPFICDFVARSAKLVIEVDGGQHAWQQRRDADRTRYLESLGFTVVRFWNNDVLERTESVVQAIEIALSRLPSPSPVSGKRCPASFRSGRGPDRPETRKREGS